MKELSIAALVNQNYCESCTSETESRKTAAVYCMECQIKLCDTCDAAHNRIPTARSHQRVKVGEEALSTKLRDHPLYCDKHTDKKTELYCNDCKIVICMTCFAAAHRAHDCHDVCDKAADFQKQMTADVTDMSASIQACSGMLVHISDECQQFLGKIDNIEQQVGIKVEELTQRIERDTQQLLDALQTLREERIKQAENLKHDIEQHRSLLSSLKNYTEELCQKGAPSEIGRDIHCLHIRATELVNLKETEVAFNELGPVTVLFDTTEQPSSGNIVGRIYIPEATCQTSQGTVCMSQLHGSFHCVTLIVIAPNRHALPNSV